MLKNNSDRKIAVIFATDVVGYSKSIEDNENQTLINLKECRGILDQLILKKNGRIFNTAGDSVLAEFDSAVASIECSIEFQEKIRERNTSVNYEKKMEFRIGIHIGDVVKDGKDLFGEGVNIAARLESFAQPNGLSISKNIYDLVKGKTNNKFRVLGIQKIKNNSVHVFDLTKEGILSKRKLAKKNSFLLYLSFFLFFIFSTLSVLYYFYNAEKSEFDIYNNKKLLILPFEVISGDESYSYLKQGTHEYLVSNLSGVKLNNEQSIEILSTSLSNSIKQKNFTEKEIFETYGANFILNGSIQISEDNIRINVKLNDVVNNKQVWTATKNSKVNEIFDLQDELAIDLLSFLGFGNQSSSRSGIMSKVKSPEEMKLLLDIIKTQRRFSGDAWKKMADLTTQFYSINPDGVAQNVMKAWEHHWKVAWGISKNIEQDLKTGISFADFAIEKSIQTNQKPQESFVVKAFLLMSSKNYDEAILFANKAKEVIVNNPEAWGAIGVVYFFCNDFKNAIDSLELQSELVMDQQLIFKDILAWAYIFENQTDKAKKVLNEIVLKKNHPNKLTLSQSYVMLSYIAFLEKDKKTSDKYFEKHLNLKNKTTLAGFRKFGRFKDISIASDVIKFLNNKGLK